MRRGRAVCAVIPSCVSPKARFGNAVSTFDPHGIVVDTFATGSLQELGPILGWPLRKIFVFRAQKSHRAHDAAFQRALSLYDLILIPHHPDEEITPQMAPTPDGVATCWTGPMTLCDHSELLSRAAARAALELPQDGKIGLIALGGGGDPDLPFARTILRRALQPAPQSLQVLAEVEWIEMAGPLEPLALAATADSAAERVWRTLRGVHPACKYLHAFDGAIGAVGYNTAYELQMAALPCVLWPFPRDVDDQAARAQFLSTTNRALTFALPAEVLPSQNAARATDEVDVEAAARQLRALLSQLFEPTAHASMQRAMSTARRENGVHVGAAALLELFPGAMDVAA